MKFLFVVLFAFLFANQVMGGEYMTDEKKPMLENTTDSNLYSNVLENMDEPTTYDKKLKARAADINSYNNVLEEQTDVSGSSDQEGSYSHSYLFKK